MQKKEKEYRSIVSRLEEGVFLCSKLNNKLLLDFLKAKFNAGFGRIVYKMAINDFSTATRIARDIHRLDEFFKKDFYDISEDEFLTFRDALNDDKFSKQKTIIKWKEQKGSDKLVMNPKIVKSDEPMSYATKLNMKSNICSFWKFCVEYHYQENKKAILDGILRELPDSTRYFKLRVPEDYKEVKVEFIPNTELDTLYKIIKNQDFKSMIQLAVMSGARPCEILNVKYGINLYKNPKGKWVIHLPQKKRHSYKKHPFVVDMYEDELYPYFNKLKLKKGDLVFTTSEQTFRKLMKHYTERALGKHYSPKTLRKTARMIRTNAKYSDTWIKKLLGHSPDSRVQSHYTNYDGVDSDEEANERLKSNQEPSIKQKYDDVKIRMQAQEQRFKELEKSNKDNIKQMQLMLTALRNPLTEGDINYKSLMENKDKYETYMKFRRMMKKEGLINGN